MTKLFLVDQNLRGKLLNIRKEIVKPQRKTANAKSPNNFKKAN